MKTVYYSHCMTNYNTEQEKQDVALLKSIGFIVCNPNTTKHRQDAHFYPSGMLRMKFYMDLAVSCDLIAFRTLENGTVSAGVALEVEAMMKLGKPVIELPYYHKLKKLTYSATLKHIRRNGKEKGGKDERTDGQDQRYQTENAGL